MRKTGLCVLAASALLAGAAQAEVIYGITSATSANLLSFDSATPASQTTIGTLSGLLQGHTWRGIDFRPATGELYAISSTANGATGQIYTVNLTTAVATPVGGTLALSGNTSTRISLDFNPVVDRLRAVTGTGQSYRIDPDTGTLIAQDSNITTVGSGATPLIAGVAYSNNFAGATQTTLYAYDFLLDDLGTIGGPNGVPSPNGGAFNIIGGSGITAFNAALGFDISGATGTAYISVDEFDSPGFNAEFYSVNLATGVFSQIGGNDLLPVLDISVLPVGISTGVPEPGTAMLALLALGGLGLRRRR